MRRLDACKQLVLRKAEFAAIEPHQVGRLQRRQAHARHALGHKRRNHVPAAHQIRLEAVKPIVAAGVGRAGRRQRERVAGLDARGRHVAPHGLAHVRIVADDGALLQPGDVERLARRAEHDGNLPRARDRQDAVMRVRRVDKVRVNLVADDGRAVAAAQRDDRRQLLHAPRAAAGVVRRAEHDRLRLAGGQLRLHVGQIHRVSAVLPAHKRAFDNPAVIGPDGHEERAVDRRIDEHAVARLRDGAQRELEARDHAGAEQHALPVDGHAVAARPVIAQRLPVGIAADRVAPRAAREHIRQRVAYGRRRREIHVRDPHRDHRLIARLGDHAVPLLAFGADPADARVKIGCVKSHRVVLLSICLHVLRPPETEERKHADERNPVSGPAPLLRPHRAQRMIQ